MSSEAMIKFHFRNRRALFPQNDRLAGTPGAS